MNSNNNNSRSTRSKKDNERKPFRSIVTATVVAGKKIISPLKPSRNSRVKETSTRANKRPSNEEWESLIFDFYVDKSISVAGFCRENEISRDAFTLRWTQSNLDEHKNKDDPLIVAKFVYKNWFEEWQKGKNRAQKQNRQKALSQNPPPLDQKTKKVSFQIHDNNSNKRNDDDINSGKNVTIEDDGNSLGVEVVIQDDGSNQDDNENTTTKTIQRKKQSRKLDIIDLRQLLNDYYLQQP